MPKIHVHLGAHKTATTHFQHCLLRSDDLLKGAGITYMPLMQVRHSLFRLVKRGRNGVIDAETIRARAPGMIAKQAAGADVLLVSDENLLGTFAPMLRTGRLYPDAPKSFEMLAHVFDGHDVEYHLCLRSYAGYFASMYCEHLRFKFTRSHQDAMPDYLANADWAPLLEAAAATLNGPLHLWKFEDYIQDPRKYLSAYTGLSPETFTLEEDETLRAAMSMEEVKLVEALVPQTKIGSRQLCFAIEEVFAEFPGKTKFNPWSAEEKAMLNARYEALDLSAYHVL